MSKNMHCYLPYEIGSGCVRAYANPERTCMCVHTKYYFYQCPLSATVDTEF